MGKQHGSERGQGASCISHLGLAEWPFASQISSTSSFHLHTTGYISLLADKSCCYNLLLIAVLSSWSCTALLGCLLSLPLPAQSGFGAGPREAAAPRLGQPREPHLGEIPAAPLQLLDAQGDQHPLSATSGLRVSQCFISTGKRWVVLPELVENLMSPSPLCHSAKARRGKWPKGSGLAAGTGDPAPLKRHLPNRGAVTCHLLLWVVTADPPQSSSLCTPGFASLMRRARVTAASQLLISGACSPRYWAVPSLPFGVSSSIASVRETSLFWFIALASLSFRKNLTLAGLAGTVTWQSGTRFPLIFMLWFFFFSVPFVRHRKNS